MADSDDAEETTGVNWRRATLIILPFLALGVGNGVLIVQWGLSPVWGLMLLGPVIFISAIGWLAIRGGIGEGETSERDGDLG